MRCSALVYPIESCKPLWWELVQWVELYTYLSPGAMKTDVAFAVVEAMFCAILSGMVHIKELLLLIGKSCHMETAGFLTPSGSLSYVRRHITVNKVLTAIKTLNQRFWISNYYLYFSHIVSESKHTTFFFLVVSKDLPPTGNRSQVDHFTTGLRPAYNKIKLWWQHHSSSIRLTIVYYQTRLVSYGECFWTLIKYRSEM